MENSFEIATNAINQYEHEQKFVHIQEIPGLKNLEIIQDGNSIYLKNLNFGLIKILSLSIIKIITENDCSWLGYFNRVVHTCMYDFTQVHLNLVPAEMANQKVVKIIFYLNQKRVLETHVAQNVIPDELKETEEKAPFKDIKYIVPPGTHIVSNNFKNYCGMFITTELDKYYNLYIETLNKLPDFLRTEVFEAKVIPFPK